MLGRQKLKSGGMRNCPKCGSRMTLSALADCGGSAHDYSVRFVNLPTLVCRDSSHPRRFVDSEFGFRLVNSLHDALPLARRRFLRRPGCRRCGAALTGTIAPSSTMFEITVDMDNAPTFSVALSGRTTTCTQCGLEQLAHDRTFYGNMPDAVLAAFKAVHLER